MKIGFIGLGNMGAPMAANLANAGYEVVGFDVTDVTVEGVTSCSDAPSCVSGCDLVITMLPNGSILQKVADEIQQSLKKGAVFLDCSTVDVDTAKSVAAQMAATDIDVLDAPVSGGISGAAAGTLTFMVGGTDTGFAAAKPVLDVMGGNIFHAGAGGNGQVAKICNNMLLGISMIGTAEAFLLGEKLGLDAQTLFDISSTASGQCWSMTSYCPAPGPVPTSPANNDYQPGFAAAMMLKDLLLSQEAANIAAAFTPMGQRATELYEQMADAGHADMDFSGIMKMLAEST